MGVTIRLYQLADQNAQTDCLRGLHGFIEKHTLTWSVDSHSNKKKRTSPGKAEDEWHIFNSQGAYNKRNTDIPANRSLTLVGHSRSKHPYAIERNNRRMGCIGAEFAAKKSYRNALILDSQQTTKRRYLADQNAAFIGRAKELGIHAESIWQNSVDDTLTALDQCMQKPGRTLIFCCSDGQAAWLRSILNDRHEAWIDHIGLLGCNNHEPTCYRSPPYLSSIDLSWFAVGQSLGQYMLRRIQSATSVTPETVNFFRIIERDSTPKRISDPLVRQAIQWLEKNLGCKRPLQETAAALGCAESTLTLHFRQFHSSSLKGTLDQMRLERATRLLSRTDKAISTIGKECGYASTSVFCTAFKRNNDATAGEWRLAMRDSRFIR